MDNCVSVIEKMNIEVDGDVVKMTYKQKIDFTTLDRQYNWKNDFDIRCNCFSDFVNMESENVPRTIR